MRTKTGICRNRQIANGDIGVFGRGLPAEQDADDPAGLSSQKWVSELGRLSRGQLTERRLVERARMVLATLDGGNYSAPWQPGIGQRLIGVNGALTKQGFIGRLAIGAAQQQRAQDIRDVEATARVVGLAARNPQHAAGVIEISVIERAVFDSANNATLLGNPYVSVRRVMAEQARGTVPISGNRRP